MHQLSREGRPGRLILAGGLFMLAIIPLLVVVAYWFPTAPGVLSAASVAGYNNGVASALAVGWAVAGVSFFWAATRLGFLPPVGDRPGEVPPAAESPVTASGPRLALQALALSAVVLILYFPPFLARYGPYVEDQVFLTALHRMHAGQAPYVDFEFLYGPLMIYAANGWTKLFGYSMVSFYGYLALLEMLVYLLLFAVVTRLVADPRRRVLVFLLFALLLFDVLLAPNQNGLRKFFPLCVILLVARRPASTTVALVAGCLLGVQLAYSQEYGVAGLLGIVAMYGLLMLRGDGWKAAMRAIVVGLAAVGTWFALAWLLTGYRLGPYLHETLSLLQRFSAGEAAFRFYWTANSLALFALLGLACIVLGQSLARPLRERADAGDRLLVAAFVYALVGLKSGLNRCDLWHLDPAFIPLVAAFVLPLRRALVPDSPALRRMATVLVVVVALTYTVGQAPLGSYYLKGLLLGGRDVVLGAGREGPAPVAMRAPAISLERTHPNADELRLAAYLAEPVRANRPVLFYGDMWALGPHIGVYKTDHLNDSFIYSDERGHALETFLADRPGAIVIIDSLVFRRLYGLDAGDSATVTRGYLRPTRVKSLISWLSSVHYRGSKVEYLVRERRWTEGVGSYVRDRFRPIASFGNMVVLGRSDAS